MMIGNLYKRKELLESLPEEQHEIYQLDGFISEDHQHVVRWHQAETQNYPIWWCLTHEKPYYSVCIFDNNLPKKS